MPHNVFFTPICCEKKHFFPRFFTWNRLSLYLVLIHHLAKCYGNAENRVLNRVGRLNSEI